MRMPPPDRVTISPCLTFYLSIRSNGSATATEASRANQVLLDYLEELVEQRMVKSNEDLISKLVVEQVSICFLASKHVEPDGLR